MLRGTSRGLHTYAVRHNALHLVGFMLLFFSLFDGIVSYTAPLVITANGFSETHLGLIIGSSSIMGALFDLVITRILKDTHFRRVFLLMFVFGAFGPLLLWQGKTIWLILMAMGVWGLYFDLRNFGELDFVATILPKRQHASGYGFMLSFQQLGYVLAPLFAGLVVGEVLDWRPFTLAWGFLLVALLFYALLRHLRVRKLVRSTPPSRFAIHVKGGKRRVAMQLLPFLLLTVVMNTWDAFFWTIGPIYSQSFTELQGLEGIFMAAYTLPALLCLWGAGPLVARFGNLRVMSVAFPGAAVPLAFLSGTDNVASVIMLISLSSVCLALAWPALKGVYADYVSAFPDQERRFQESEDLAGNAGYIIGPVTAGLVADAYGAASVFSLLAVIGVVAIGLFWVLRVLFRAGDYRRTRVVSSTF